MLSKKEDQAELRRLVLRYGHSDIASALVDIARDQETTFPNAESRIAARQRTEIWLTAYNSLIALGMHQATSRKAKGRAISR